uniref:Uncharacterized protein n=1 Tax=Arundo donax TaxID=35708 RepID=A0A0A9C4T2_ARUDO
MSKLFAQVVFHVKLGSDPIKCKQMNGQQELQDFPVLICISSGCEIRNLVVPAESG